MKISVHDIDRKLLVKLWSTALPDKVLEVRLGVCRGSFRRFATQIGLPPRSVARQLALEEERPR